MAKLSLSFGQNVLAETQAYELHIRDEKKLRGLPESLIEMAKSIAEKKGKKGWIITLDYPIYIPFTKYSEERELEKKLHLLLGKEVIKKIKTIILRLLNKSLYSEKKEQNSWDTIHMLTLFWRREWLVLF